MSPSHFSDVIPAVAQSSSSRYTESVFLIKCMWTDKREIILQMFKSNERIFMPLFKITGTMSFGDGVEGKAEF